LKHFAAPEFWHYYRQLPHEVRRLADQKFALLKRPTRVTPLFVSRKSGNSGQHGLAFAIEP
jgi:hypothetical protein